MATYVVKNKTSFRLFVPPPVNRFLIAGQQVTVSVPAATMDSTAIASLVSAGLLYVEASNDPSTSEALELAPVSVGSGVPTPAGQAGKALFSDGLVAGWREVRATDIAPLFAITSFAVSGATREVGESVGPASFTAAYVRTPTAAVLTDNAGSGPLNVVGTPTAFSSTGPFSKTTNNDSVIFTLTADDGVDPTDVATATMRWRPRGYYGVGINQVSATEAFIEALASSQLLASRTLTFSATAGAAEHIYYAFPASYGTPTFTVNGFVGGFELVGSVNVTNTFGVTQSYAMWKSTNPNLGSTTVAVT